MSSWAQILNTILSAGTWTNHGSQPITHVLYTDSIRIRPPCIILENDDEDPTSDHKGKILMRKKTGFLTIVSGNITTRDNIKEDVEAILLASNYSTEIIGETPNEPQKNRFEYELNIRVLD